MQRLVRVIVDFSQIIPNGPPLADSLVFTPPDDAAAAAILAAVGTSDQALADMMQTRIQNLTNWLQSQPGIQPAPTRVLDKFTYRQRFTFQEQVAIENPELNTALQPTQIATVRTILSTFRDAQTVDLDDPITKQSLDVLVSFGLLAPERVNQILGIPPA
jgi:hypothetical protein